MDGYELILYLWLSTLTAILMGKALKASGEVPKGQDIKPTTAKQVCMFYETCGCKGDCFSDFATKENSK